MSGHKRETVTISQEEYRRMYEAERAALYSAYTIPCDNPQTQFHHETEILNSIFENQAVREDAYSEVIDNMTSQLKLIEATSQQIVEQERAKIQYDIQSAVTQSDEKALRLLQEYSRQMEDDFEKQRQTIEYNAQLAAVDLEEKLQSRFERRVRESQLETERYQTRADARIYQIENEVRKINQRNQHLRDSAKSWLEDSSLLADFIDQQYDARFQDFDEMTHIRSLINQSIINFENGIYEACISNCQIVGHQMSALRIRLENRVMEYGLVYSNLLVQIEQFYEQVIGSRTIPAISLNKQDEKLTLHLDEWAKEEFGDLVNSIENLLITLHDDTQPISLHDLLQIQEITFANLRADFYELIDTAQVQSLNAQIRFNVAQLVVSALVSQGHRLDSCGFTDGDYSAPYTVKASSVDGSRVLIRIDPIEGELMSTHLHIIADDPIERTHTELVQRAKELNRCLRHMGLQIQNQREITHPERVTSKQTRMKTPKFITVD